MANKDAQPQIQPTEPTEQVKTVEPGEKKEAKTVEEENKPRTPEEIAATAQNDIKKIETTLDSTHDLALAIAERIGSTDQQKIAEIEDWVKEQKEKSRETYDNLIYALGVKESKATVKPTKDWEKVGGAQYATNREGDVIKKDLPDQASEEYRLDEQGKFFQKTKAGETEVNLAQKIKEKTQKLQQIEDQLRDLEKQQDEAAKKGLSTTEINKKGDELDDEQRTLHLELDQLKKLQNKVTIKVEPEEIKEVTEPEIPPIPSPHGPATTEALADLKEIEEEERQKHQERMASQTNPIEVSDADIIEEKDETPEPTDLEKSMEFIKQEAEAEKQAWPEKHKQYQEYINPTPKEEEPSQPEVSLEKLQPITDVFDQLIELSKDPQNKEKARQVYQQYFDDYIQGKYDKLLGAMTDEETDAFQNYLDDMWQTTNKTFGDDWDENPKTPTPPAEIVI